MMDGARTTDANGDLGLQLFLWGFFSNFLPAAKTLQRLRERRRASHSAVLRIDSYRLWEARILLRPARTAVRGD